MMTIQWFPGHMHLTRQAIAARVKAIDVVLEVLDARLPGSSANPLLADLAGHKPTLKLLNKQDMADPQRTVQWLAYYNAQKGTRAVPMQATRSAPVQRMVAACRDLAPTRIGVARPMRVLVCGIPNVGKSTLINHLAGKRQAATGDEAGVTKQEQRIVLADDFYLYDTPGMLWPRILAPQCGTNLAASGAMGRNAFDEELVALNLLSLLKRHYPQCLQRRYSTLGNADPGGMQDEDLLEAIGRQRGALLGGARVNTQKAAEILLTDFRSSALGAITLETPMEFTQWMEQGAQKERERQEQLHLRKMQRRAREEK